jgi:ABC-type dipeptide/oligopeptide/nickel transport system permease component
VLAVGLAVLVARWPNGIVDRLSLVISMMGLSVAPYVLAVVLIYLFAVKVQWFPAIGYTSPSVSCSAERCCPAELSRAVHAHKSRPENLVPLVNSALPYADRLVWPHNGPGRKLVAAVVDLARAGSEDSQCGR